MAIDLMAIAPHQVSRSLRGYSVMFYGEPKSGKTTIATKFPKHLILAFEKGYSAIPGAMAQPVNRWSEFKQILRQLNSDAAKERFETVIIDTADIAYDYCEKFICQRESVDTIGQVPFGGGYAMAKKEFDECLRSIVQMNYGLVLISHSQNKTFTNELGVETSKIVPTLANAPRLVCQRMCDIIGYSRAVETQNGIVTKLFLRGTPMFDAGSRFKYTPDHIDFNYKELTKAISDAIDKQTEEDGVEYFTDSKVNLHQETEAELDYDALVAEFNTLVTDLMSKQPDYYGPRIQEIVAQKLGKGKRVAECSRDQAELISLVVADVKELHDKIN